MPKEADAIGPLDQAAAIVEYQQRFGRPPMEDPPAVWANMACWMAHDARTVVAFQKWFERMEAPPVRFVQRPHKAPEGRRKLVIPVVPKDLEAVYGWRRRGLPHQIRKWYGEIEAAVQELSRYEELLRSVQLVGVVPPAGRIAEWGFDAFAFMFPFLWTRHGERPRMTTEIMALAARALVIGDDGDPNPVDYWRKRRARLLKRDQAEVWAGPETALIRMVQREHGDEWESALRGLLAQGVVREVHDGPPQSDPGGPCSNPR